MVTKIAFGVGFVIVLTLILLLSIAQPLILLPVLAILTVLALASKVQ